MDQVESLINNSVKRHTEIRKQLIDNRSMLDTFFDKNTEYQEIEKQIKQLQKQKQILKAKIMKEGEPARLQEKIKELKSQDKEIKTALSDYLVQYSKKYETTQIELDDGVVRTIIFTSKLVNLK